MKGVTLATGHRSFLVEMCSFPSARLGPGDFRITASDFVGDRLQPRPFAQSQGDTRSRWLRWATELADVDVASDAYKPPASDVQL